MQSQNVQASSNLDALKSPVLQAELLDASDIIALQLAESERTDSVNAAGDAERINLDELLENDFASLTTSLKVSYADLQSRVMALTQELSSARAARQEELAEKERLAHRLTALVDALPGGVLVLDQNHTIILANPGAADLLGEPLLNMNFLSVIGECAASISRDGTQMVLRSGRRISLSTELNDGYGDQVVLVTDVTETYAAQEESHRSERLTALGEMVARLAHQIRTPLSSALLYMGAMERPTLADDARLEVTSKVKGRLKHLESLVNDSLQFVKGGETQDADCSLFELLQALKVSLAPLLAQHNGAWCETGLTRDVLIEGNQEALLSALVAIAENALQVTPNAVLTVTTEITDSGLEMSIRDNGPGIAQDALSRIFDPYFTTRAGGTGLGLALCAMIARNHDATLVASNPAAGGAEFKFTLPHARFKVAPASLPTASAGVAVINAPQQPTPLEPANHGAVIHG